MEFNFTLSPEMMQKANAARTPEELQALAKENGMELTAEQAQEYFAQLHKTGELDDDELDSVAGGGCGQDEDDRIINTYLYVFEPKGAVCQYFKCTHCGQGQSKFKTFTEPLGAKAIKHDNCGVTVACALCEYHVWYAGKRIHCYYCTHPANKKQ